MRKETQRKLDRSELEPAVRDILDRHPDGLGSVTIRRELNRHPMFEFDIPMQHLHAWLGALIRAGVLVSSENGKVYQLAEHAE